MLQVIKTLSNAKIEAIRDKIVEVNKPPMVVKMVLLVLK